VSDEGYELTDILRASNEATLDGINVALPGIVVSYSAAKQTATVRPAVKVPRKVAGKFPSDETGITYQTLPDLPDVPIAWASGGGYVATFPLAANDPVMLIFSSVAFGEYMLSGKVSEPKDTRKHSLGYPIAIPGGARPDTKPILDASATEMVIGKDNGDPQVRIGATTITLGKGATDAVALASKVLTELQAIKTAYDGHTHTAPGGATGVPIPLLPTPGSVASTLIKAK